MKNTALYIHIPFCKSKCFYCDFCSYANSEELMEEYTQALCSEIENCTQNQHISTIFIGGGTPTYLNFKAWMKLGDVIKKLDLDSNLEFTVECNPGTIQEDVMIYLKSIGVNRISMGLQAWQDRLLKLIGRIHSQKDFVDGFKILRNIGFTNINIDVIFGLPTQTMEDFRETLEKIAAMKPEHISCYSLIVEKNTPFGRMYDEGKLELMSDDDVEDMYQFAKRYMNEYGYKQYEISNFAKEGRECRHNTIYWNLGDYLGCGAAAHSYIYNKRYRNEENIKKYINRIDETGSAVVEEKENTLKDNMEEFMFMGLRMMKGVSEEDFKNRFKKDISEVYGAVIDKYTNLKLLCRERGRLYLSDRGIEISNTIMSDFLL
ncbi:oxygen-independent coproporphyrinogen-III oxidase-like protein YqeR [Clostridium oryzae]|uniref:Heme chaperone HemW n=1 Tax=Clostridium oryzae TaxID=1450648 RepID=A0A1V4IVA4_9CLOT|nr:radical SAM family heme chaperone HemW [Clostridium oryzae]OPJ63839.1 oxygen-independent coproporphyrinogen-III oxidase-like protein YqeR [Clostridium oryzae]